MSRQWSLFFNFWFQRCFFACVDRFEFRFVAEIQIYRHTHVRHAWIVLFDEFVLFDLCLFFCAYAFVLICHVHMLCFCVFVFMLDSLSFIAKIYYMCDCFDIFMNVLFLIINRFFSMFFLCRCRRWFEVRWNVWIAIIRSLSIKISMLLRLMRKCLKI